MAVKDWHPGKIGLMWGVYLVLLWFLWEMNPGDDEGAISFWAVLAIPAFVITWRWFSGREKKK